MKNITNELVSIVRRAGRIMTGACDIEASGSVDEKSGDAANLVTAYDLAVQRFLITEITRLVPEAYFFAEEKENEYEAMRGECCFVIDPIDGTANFVHDYHHSCISLAMFSRGDCIFSIVYDPYLDELFSAEKGRGASLNGRAIRVSDRDEAHSIVAFGTSPYYKSLADKTFSLCRRLFERCADLRRCGAAALDLAYVAAGRNDMFFEYRLSPWDVAAGYLLIREAGGVITDMEGKELDFSAPCGVIAANPGVYGSLLSEVREA